MKDDLINRQDALDAIVNCTNCGDEKTLRAYVAKHNLDNGWTGGILEAIDAIEDLPSAQPEKETPKRVLWSGWKGMRDTRYKCPNCKKPVRNTDIYCHRCGQKLMFPNIDFTPYVEGQKQELIVRWDDEE